MKKIIDGKKNGDFTSSTYEINFLHKDEFMWQKYGVPALVSGFQLLCTSLASAEKDKLLGINYAKAFFSAIVPVGSEVDFDAKEEKTGVLKKEIFLRLSAVANGFDALGKRKEPAIAEKRTLVDRPTFYEGSQSLNIRVNDVDLNTFKQLTGLPDETVPILYATCLSSASITSGVQNPTTPSWRELNFGFSEAGENERTIPTYTSIEFYLPSGMRSFEPRSELILRSSIRKDAAVYVVDTICHDRNGMLYGARAHLKQRKQGVLIDAISALLDKIEVSGNPGSLSEVVERRKQIKEKSNPRQNPHFNQPPSSQP